MGVDHNGPCVKRQEFTAFYAFRLRLTEDDNCLGMLLGVNVFPSLVDAGRNISARRSNRYLEFFSLCCHNSSPRTSRRKPTLATKPRKFYYYEGPAGHSNDTQDSGWSCCLDTSLTATILQSNRWSLNRQRHSLAHLYSI